jgi:phage terminase Nu1 subunit (DNA packaging protein)
MPEVDVQTMMTYLKCSRAKVAKLADMGIVIRTSRGKYDLIPSVQNAFDHYRSVAAGRSNLEVAEAKMISLKAGAALKGIQQRIFEEKLKRMSGGWVLESHVCEQWKRNANEFRTWALDQPAKILHALDLSVAQEDLIIQPIDEGLRWLSTLDDSAGMAQEAAE